MFVCKSRLTLHQLNVNNACLHGNYNQIVFIVQSPRFECKGEYVCQLKKSIHGLKPSHVLLNFIAYVDLEIHSKKVRA
ncbi:hypothetical protein CK203_111352 [Vitis vinifera]|uniref:Reverse transcriptase Ty1/copia-type domain-containing protein n=1 Tax=Vitis vinifera TaxID=29760 RepID=A0A438DH19_VITVI|nr:hypothetical protein CK203_111352 [Vitis vinifera]